MTEPTTTQEKQTSSIVTGGVTVTAAAFAPLVSWALNGFPLPIPETVPYLVAAAVITLGHAIYNVRISRYSTGVKT